MILKLVELLGRYSNQDRLLTNLQALLEFQPFRPPDQPERPRQRQTHLTAEQQAELLERYLAGERAFELAKAFNVDRRTVGSLLKRTGLRRPRSMTPDEIAEAARLYEQGWSCARIGQELGRDHGTVWLALKAAGVSLRPPSSPKSHRFPGW